jgi:SAM-dependent methyltransferase
MKYQSDYSLHFPATKDISTRQRKAFKILRALTAHLAREDLRGLICLDLGCSVGVISRTLAQAGANVVGLDIDEPGLRVAASQPGEAAAFVLGDGGATPFPDEMFDVLICSQVYEHSPSLALLAREMRRVLKFGGVGFFSGPNRWAVMEEHYHLPFLSWLPKPWADRYVRWTGRAGEYYERPRSAGELRRALSGFAIHDLTPMLLQHPEQYALEPEVGWVSHAARRAPEWSWALLGRLVPNFNWLLVKVRP